MLNQGQNGTAENFFKSINIRLDVPHPERFSHFHPTKNNVRIIRALTLGEPSPASMIVAAYGSGKSLAAGTAALIVRNDEVARAVLSSIIARVGLVDGGLGVAFAERVNLKTRGMSIVLEGYEPDMSNEIFAQAKERVSSIRRPRNHGGDVIKILESVWGKAVEEGFDRITILWDEFGRHLEALASSGNTEELLSVQRVSEWASRKDSPSVTLGLILHQSFLHYADNLSQTARSGWKKIEGRFDTVHYFEDSREMYELVASVVKKLRGGVEPRLSPRQFEKQSDKALKLGLFEAFGDKHSLAETLKSSFPLHPLTLYALPRLAARLAQNERTVFSFVRDVASDESASFGDLYGYFSGAMAADTGVGGAYRRWLETESALSKANNAVEREILRSVAVLGFGVSGERVRVKKDLLEFAVSGFRGLSLSRIRETIEDLIDRKLLLYRKRNDDISVWHGTDVDIRGYLKEEIFRVESEFTAVDILLKEYPAPNWRPVAHNVKNSIRRFFAGKYLSAGELLQKRLSHSMLKLNPGEDGRVIYCLAETSDEVLKLASFMNETRSLDPAVIFVIPRKPVPILGIALEIVALGRMQKNHDIIAVDPFITPELRHMVDSAREDLTRVMNRVVRPGPDNGMWFSKGRSLSVAGSRELHEKLSEISDARFPATPVINNELVVRREISRPMINARKKLILGILERSGEPDLGFDRKATTPDVSMYRTVLEKAGLYGFCDGTWRWAEPSQLEDENLAEVWGVLWRFFEDAGQAKSPATELFDKLESPPYGMRKGVLPVFVAAALQAFGRAVVIRREGEYLPDVLASEIEEFCLSPEKFTVDVINVDPFLSRYLGGLIERFDGRRPVASGDLIRQFHDALELWKAQLPDQALRTSCVSESARSFQAILRKDTDPVLVAMKEFPRLAGTDEPNGKTSKLVEELIREIEGIVNGYIAKAISITHETFNVGSGETQGLLDRARTWSMCFDEKSVDLSKLDSMSKAVLTRAREATEDRYTEASFVRALSSMLLGKGFDKWDDSSPREFTERIREIVTKLERISLEAAEPSAALLPLLDGHFHRLYGQLERMLGPQDAAEKISALLVEKKKEHSGLRGDLKSNGTYEKSA